MSSDNVLFFIADYLVIASNRTVLYQWDNSTNSFKNITVSAYSIMGDGTWGLGVCCAPIFIANGL